MRARARVNAAFRNLIHNRAGMCEFIAKQDRKILGWRLSPFSLSLLCKDWKSLYRLCTDFLKLILNSIS